MEKFGIILCLIGLLGTFCLIGYAIYVPFGWFGLASYIFALCVAVGGSILSMI